MTRELAISILVGETIGTTEQINEAVKMAVDALMADVPDIRVGKWIPCSERLPEKGEKVLASTKNTVFTQVFKGTQGTSDSWWWNNNTIKTIYAWMSLPEPYREEQE